MNFVKMCLMEATLYKVIVRTKKKTTVTVFSLKVLYWLNKTTDCSQTDVFTWLLAAFPIMRFFEAKDTQALDGRQKEYQQTSMTPTEIVLLTNVAEKTEL